MAKKPPSMDDLVAGAKETQGAKIASIDSKIKRTITVTIDEVIACPFNPRSQRNPKYEQIKESIRQRGLDHAPNITREKPADPYMIKDGGNTRLEILKELWDETKDEQFYRFESTFHPWSSASDLLIGHLIENDLRGDTLFIERAIAAVNLKAMLDEQADGEPLSIRGAAKQFTELGWVIDPGSLTVLFYAHDELFPFIPQAFWAGMGRSKVRQLRKIYSAYAKYCKAVQLPDTELDICWHTALSTIDDEDFNIGAVVLDTNNALAQQLDTYGHLINGEIDAIMRGAEPTGRLSTKSEAEARFAANSQQRDAATPSPQATTDTGLAQSFDNRHESGANVDPTRQATAQPAMGDIQNIYNWVMAQRKTIFELSQQLLKEVRLNPDISEFTPYSYYGYQMNIAAMFDTFEKNATNNNIGRSAFMLTLYGLCGWHDFSEGPNLYTQSVESSDQRLQLESHIWRVVFSLRTTPWPEGVCMNLTVRELERLIAELRLFALKHFGHDRHLEFTDLWRSQETFGEKLGAIEKQKQQNK